MPLNQLLEVAPAGAVIGAMLWGGLSYQVNGPQLANRVANADYIQDCKENLATNIAATFDKHIAAANSPTKTEQQSAAAAPMINQMFGQYGDQMAFLDMLTGGAYSQTMQITQDAARQAREAREQAAAAIKRQRDTAIATAPDQCSCQVAAALNETRTDWAILAGTLGFLEKDGVTNFASAMRANARMCAERVTP